MNTTQKPRTPTQNWTLDRHQLGALIWRCQTCDAWVRDGEPRVCKCSPQAEKLAAHATTADDLLRHHRELVALATALDAVLPPAPPTDQPTTYPRAFPLVEESRTGQRVIYLRKGDLVGITVEEIDQLRERNDLLLATKQKQNARELKLQTELAAAAEELAGLHALAEEHAVQNHRLTTSNSSKNKEMAVRDVDHSSSDKLLRAELAAATQEAVDQKAKQSALAVENHNLSARLKAALELLRGEA